MEKSTGTTVGRAGSTTPTHHKDAELFSFGKLNVDGLGITREHAPAPSAIRDLHSLGNTRETLGAVRILKAADLTILAKIVATVALSRATVHCVVIVRVVRVLMGGEVGRVSALLAAHLSFRTVVILRARPLPKVANFFRDDAALV